MKIFCLLSEALGCERKWDLQPGAASALTLLFVLCHPEAVQQVQSLSMLHTISHLAAQHGSPIMHPHKLYPLSHL